MQNIQQERFKSSQNVSTNPNELTFTYTCKTIATALIITMFVNFITNLSLATVFQFAGGGEPSNSLKVLTTLLTTIVLTIFIVHRYRKRLHITLLQASKTNNVTIRKYLIFIVTTLGITLLFTIVTVLLHAALKTIDISLTTNNYGLQDNFVFNSLLILLVCIVGPISEELIFRGIILSSLKRFGTTFAVLTTSLLFALIHRNFIQGIPTFFLSLFLCYIVLKTNSIYSGIAIHIINNTFAMIMNFAQDHANMTNVFSIIVLFLLLFSIIYAIIKRKRIASFIFSKHETKVRSFFGNWVSMLLLLIFLYYFIINISIS